MSNHNQVFPKPKKPTPFAYEEVRENTPAKRNNFLQRRNTTNWGFEAIKGFLSAPFSSTKNKQRSKQNKANQSLAHNFRDWIKLIRIK